MYVSKQLCNSFIITRTGNKHHKAQEHVAVSASLVSSTLQSLQIRKRKYRKETIQNNELIDIDIDTFDSGSFDMWCGFSKGVCLEIASPKNQLTNHCTAHRFLIPKYDVILQSFYLCTKKVRGPTLTGPWREDHAKYHRTRCKILRNLRLASWNALNGRDMTRWGAHSQRLAFWQSWFAINGKTCHVVDLVAGSRGMIARRVLGRPWCLFAEKTPWGKVFNGSKWLLFSTKPSNHKKARI